MLFCLPTVHGLLGLSNYTAAIPDRELLERGRRHIPVYLYHMKVHDGALRSSGMSGGPGFHK
jgi:hypothetical protein